MANIDPRHAAQFERAKDMRHKDALTISDAFTDLQVIADSMEVADETWNGISLRLVLLGIAAAGAEAANRQHMLLNPNSYNLIDTAS